MSKTSPLRKFAVAAFLGTALFAVPPSGAAAADSVRLDELYEKLQAADPAEARRIEREIELEMSRSGSATMDLLFKRGRDALEAGRFEDAVDHLTALTDHAPDFAEAFFYRAITFMRLEEYGLALGDLERTLALHPRHYDAIGALGSILHKLNRPEMAYEAYQHALEINPHHRQAGPALERLRPELSGTDI